MNILLDCGYNLGSYSKEKIETYEKIYGFDPIEIPGRFDHPKIHFIEKAVSIFNGSVDMYITDNPEGNSVYKNIRCVVKTKLPVVKRVECMDLSEFIECISDEHTIDIKLDIEGEEYNVLNRLVLTNTINKISNCTVEFHNLHYPRELRTNYHNESERLIGVLKDRGVKVIKWH